MARRDVASMPRIRSTTTSRRRCLSRCFCCFFKSCLHLLVFYPFKSSRFTLHDLGCSDRACASAFARPSTRTERPAISIDKTSAAAIADIEASDLYGKGQSQEPHSDHMEPLMPSKHDLVKLSEWSEAFSLQTFAFVSPQPLGRRQSLDAQFKGTNSSKLKELQ